MSDVLDNRCRTFTGNKRAMNTKLRSPTQHLNCPRQTSSLLPWCLELYDHFGRWCFHEIPKTDLTMDCRVYTLLTLDRFRKERCAESIVMASTTNPGYYDRMLHHQSHSSLWTPTSPTRRNPDIRKNYPGVSVSLATLVQAVSSSRHVSLRLYSLGAMIAFRRLNSLYRLTNALVVLRPS